MKHAGEKALDELSRLVEQIQRLPGLTERSPGSFYVRRIGFLHFHEDPAGMFADLKMVNGAWERMRSTSAREQATLMRLVREELRARGIM